MTVRDYFIATPDVQAMIRKKTLRTLEDLYIYEMTDEDSDLSFEEFLDRTLKDMELVENYEGAQCLKDIKRFNGWK